MSPEWHPRVKLEHAKYRTADGRVRFGGGVFGIAAEVVDSTGSVWTMLCAADGTRTVDQIVDAVRREHPDERAEAVREALTTFAEAGYLDDAAAPDPPWLTEREKLRYDRSMRLHRWMDLAPRDHPWEPQRRLREASVLLVGLGGTGGVAAQALVASGVGRLYCVDSDRVELSNLNRQVIYGEADIGRLKVEAAVERLRGLNSDVEVDGETATVAGEADIERLLRGHDVLVLCADRPGEIRAWANRVCLRSGTPWVEGGYHGPQVAAEAYVPGQGPCYECNWMAEFEFHRRANPDRTYTVQRASVDAANAVSAGLGGYLVAHLAIALLTGVGTVQPGSVYGFNLAVADDHVLVRNGRHPDCPACGPAPQPVEARATAVGAPS